MTDRREAVQFLVAGGLSVQRACGLVHLHRATFRYQAHPVDDTALLQQIEKVALWHPRYGYRRIWAVLRRTHPLNRKRVHRLWKRARLQVKRVSRRRTHRQRAVPLVAAYPQHVWAYDVVEDHALDGRSLRILTVMDEFTREGLAIDVASSTSAQWVISRLMQLVAIYGAPA